MVKINGLEKTGARDWKSWDLNKLERRVEYLSLRKYHSPETKITSKDGCRKQASFQAVSYEGLKTVSHSTFI